MQQDSQQALNDYYGKAYDEGGRLHRDRAHSVEWITTCEAFRRLLPPYSAILDACAGTGAYAFDLAKAGHTVTAGDLMPNHVAAMRERQRQEPLLKDIYEGSALDLSRFPDAAFDAVLNMGALYHLKDAADREASVRECLRVLKPGGLLFAATIHRHANVLKFSTSLADGGDPSILGVSLHSLYVGRKPAHEPLLLVSACLVGVNCRYNGGSTRVESLVRLFEAGKALPVCPEMLGGLSAPRSPCEIVKADDGTERVMDRDGVDRTDAFRAGAEKTLAICRAAGIRKAVLQQRSPTCGHGVIYDGSFQSVRITGNGITARLLEANGIEVLSDEDWVRHVSTDAKPGQG